MKFLTVAHIWDELWENILGTYLPTKFLLYLLIFHEVLL